MRRALKRLARIGMHQLGGLQPILWRSRNKYRILTYHRFAPELYPSVEVDLQKHCAFLRKYFEVIPLAEIGRCIDSGQKLPPNALAVTIDDGYRDFFEVAFPVFRTWKIPATVFLITDFLDGKLWPWWNQIEYAVMHTQVPYLTSELRPGETLPLANRDQKVQAVSTLCLDIAKLRNKARLDFMRVLPELLRVDLPSKLPRQYQPMSWDEVRSLAGNGIEFGAHTKTHPVLTSLEDPESVYDEVAGSKARLDQELGQATLHFCYPNGDWNDAVLKAVERCNFQTAVTTKPGFNGPGAHRYRLHRLSVEPGFPDYYFREEVAGLHL